MAVQATVMPRRQTRHQIAEEIAPIRHLLKALQERIGSEPELREAIVRLEILLGKLTCSSGGML